jgi:hypothetical protein
MIIATLSADNTHLPYIPVAIRRVCGYQFEEHVVKMASNEFLSRTFEKKSIAKDMEVKSHSN